MFFLAQVAPPISRVRKINKTMFWTQCDTWWSICELNYFFSSSPSSDTSGCSASDASIDENDIPGQTFDILHGISTEIFVKEYTNHEVVTVFAFTCMVYMQMNTKQDF